jgi:hypothetical protein
MANVNANPREPPVPNLEISLEETQYRAFSPLNALLMGLGAFWFIPVKSLVEEDFLRVNEFYQKGCQEESSASTGGGALRFARYWGASTSWAHIPGLLCAFHLKISMIESVTETMRASVTSR